MRLPPFAARRRAQARDGLRDDGRRRPPGWRCSLWKSFAIGVCVGFLSDACPLEGRNRENAAHHREWKFQVQVDRKGSDVPEAVPDRPADGEVNGFDLNCQPETVRRVEF